MPRKGSRPNPVIIHYDNDGGAVDYEWTGQKGLEDLVDVMDEAFEIVLRRAEHYWRTEEWTKANHPFMSGEERDSWESSIEATDDMKVEIHFGASSAHAGYVEFGTSRAKAKHPIRNVLDRYGYRVADVLQEVAKDRGML